MGGDVCDIVVGAVGKWWEQLGRLDLMSDEANLIDARQVMHFFAAQFFNGGIGGTVLRCPWISLRAAEGAQVG